MPADDQRAVDHHHQRSYGRDPMAEAERLPRPDLQWMVRALERGDPAVDEMVASIREAYRQSSGGLHYVE
jgi:hypothetical protein